MLDVMSARQVTDEFVDYIAADLRFTDADQAEPVLASTADQRTGFPVVVIGCFESGLLAGIKLKPAGIPFTIVDKQSGVDGTVDLAGKRVPVIGAGASGFQLVPAIADTAAHVDVYQRTAQ